MIKAVLFDIDGVLLDSLAANTLFYQNLVTAYGYRRPSRKEVRRIFSLNLSDAIRRLTKERSKKRLEEIHEAGRTFDYPYDKLGYDRNMERVVARLGRNYLLGMVTNRVREGTVGIFPNPNFIRRFKAIVTFDDTPKHKPSPEPLLLAAKRLRVKPAECVYIGDSDIDASAARAARMRFIGYSNRGLRCDANVSGFLGIPRALKKLEKGGRKT